MTFVGENQFHPSCSSDLVGSRIRSGVAQIGLCLRQVAGTGEFQRGPKVGLGGLGVIFDHLRLGTVSNMFHGKV